MQSIFQCRSKHDIYVRVMKTWPIILTLEPHAAVTLRLLGCKHYIGIYITDFKAKSILYNCCSHICHDRHECELFTKYCMIISENDNHTPNMLKDFSTNSECKSDDLWPVWWETGGGFVVFRQGTEKMAERKSTWVKSLTLQTDWLRIFKHW